MSNKDTHNDWQLTATRSALPRLEEAAAHWAHWLAARAGHFSIASSHRRRKSLH